MILNSFVSCKRDYRIIKTMLGMMSLYKNKKHKKGITLIEIIVSLALIGIIIIGFMPLFILSAKGNSKSENTLESTYQGKDTMELIYYLSKNITYDELEQKLKDRGYSLDKAKGFFTYKYDDNKYTILKIKEENNLVRVIVENYKDINMTELEAKYESLYSWRGKGVLNEK